MMAEKKGGNPAPNFAPDPWCLEQNLFDADSLSVAETLTAQANGYIGTRGTYEEPMAGTTNSVEGTYLNGVYMRDPIYYDESAYGFASHNNKMILVADAKAMRLEAEGELLKQGSGQIRTQQRSLDMKDGLLTRNSSWLTRSGAKIRIHTRRMVCATRPNLMVLEYKIQSVDFCGDLSLETGLDAGYGNITDTEDPRAGALSISDCLSDAQLHSCGIQTTVSHRITGSEHAVLASCLMETECMSVQSAAPVERENFWGNRVSVSLSPNDSLTVRKYIYYADGGVSERADMANRAVAALSAAQLLGFEELLQEQRDIFSTFWASANIEISGAPAVQQGMRFNLFHLFQSAGKDGERALGAKGLTGPGYDGHYFWDTEIYAVPFFVFSDPSTARALITYRINTLGAARQRAREMGHTSGALYPWRTIGGEECSSFFPAGSAQYHINAAIAYALMQYIDATGDESLLHDGGAEMLFETARIWMQLGHFSQAHGGQFSIHEVTGPDEYSAMVDNNLYTNGMAQHHLERANDVAVKLEKQSPKQFEALSERISLTKGETLAWQAASNAMYLPFDDTQSVHMQHEGFLAKPEWDFAGTPSDKYPLLLHFHPLVIYRHQVLKQADVVLAQLLLSDRFSKTEKANNLAYYEPRTTHDSTLSACIYSIANAEVGDKKRAYSMFEETYRMDLENRHGNSHYGLHMACMAGSWMALTYGFAGMRFSGGVLSFNPYLPEGWGDFSFRLSLQSGRLKITVTAAGINYDFNGDKPLTVMHRSTAIVLTPGKIKTVT